MIDCQVQYLDAGMPRLAMDSRGDWVDVRVSRVEVEGTEQEMDHLPGMHKDDTGVRFRFGDRVVIYLGFAMRFPKHYEAHLLARSSLFKRSGLILQHGMGVIDHTYCGPDDEWILPCVALRGGWLRKYQRVAQFRLISRMLPIHFTTVEELPGESRGGYGSTDRRPDWMVCTEDDGYQD